MPIKNQVKMPTPNRPRPTTSMPVIAPPRKAASSAGGTPPVARVAVEPSTGLADRQDVTLSATGLRISEALRLKVNDVDWGQACTSSVGEFRWIFDGNSLEGVSPTHHLVKMGVRPHHAV